MERRNGSEKKLLRPTASLKSKANSTSSAMTGESIRSSTEPAANGSSPSIPQEVINQISNNAMSPVTPIRPGRLASFRPERDLTLSSVSKPSNLSAAAAAASVLSGGAKPKKNFAPTIPIRRGKAQESEKTEEKFPSESLSSQRGRGRRDDSNRGRGRGRGKPELIQTTGSVFGEGISVEVQKRTSSSGSWGKEPNANNIERPTLNLQNLSKKIDKDKEDAKLKELLRDDFIDDDVDHAPELTSIPIQLPKSNLNTILKEDAEYNEIVQTSLAPQYVGDVAIKQEKVDEPVTAPAVKVEKSYQRKKATSQITQAADIFKKDGDIIFFQLPDVLPSLKADKEKDRPEIKTEPGTAKQDKTSSESKAADKDSEKSKDLDGTLSSLPEGRLGTLRIHQSGKVTMQLGDHMFIVDGGTQVSFLQDLISVKVDQETKTGCMTALGPIRYKAVCLPDWEHLIGDT